MKIRPIQLPEGSIATIVNNLTTVTLDELQQLVIELRLLNQGDRSLAALVKAEAHTPKLELIKTLVNLNRQQVSLYDQPVSIAQYFDQVMEQVEQAFHESSIEFDETKRFILDHLLQAALFTDSGLGAVLKYSDMSTYHQKNFSKIQVVSDIRPVFPSDDSVTLPRAAVIVHTMKVTYQEQPGAYLDVFIGLNTEELYEVQRCIQRALEKAKVLDTFLGGAGFKSPYTGLEE